MLAQSVQLLAINFALALGCVLVLWLVCLKTRDPTPMDSFWGLGLALLSVSSLLQTGAATPRKLLLTGICVAWGVRLGAYLFWRWRGHGPDPRYATMLAKAREERGWSYARASLSLIFLLQVPLLWLVGLPVQLGQVAAAPLGALAAIGAALAGLGLVFETVGDAQLTRFKADPANRGRVMDRGLWRYTRHPNYFGDACVWWGLYLIAAETGPGRFAVIGPVFLTYTLIAWSGAALLERRLSRSKPDYLAYAARTSGFVPWFPKRG